MIQNDLKNEIYREYDIPGRLKPYRINSPITLYMREKGTTHRVLDSKGIVHCIPFPGNGTILRWKNKDDRDPVTF